LAGSDKAAEHPFDLATLLAKTIVRFGIKPANVVRDPELGL
jgi:hypothetical protein